MAAPEEIYQCQTVNCGYIYNPDKGDRKGKIPPGVKFENLPEEWRCPICGGTKRCFRPLAGPGSNLLLLCFSVALLRALAFLPQSQILDQFIMAMLYLVMINAVLLLFNLIPLPPLDGHHVLEFFMPYEMQKKFERIGPYSVLILFFLVFYLNILNVPMALMFKGALYGAFYGTPIWEDITSGSL